MNALKSAHDDALVAAVRGDRQILVERHLTNLERPDRFLVPVLKILGVEAKTLDRGVALLAVPSVAAEHAADVEQHELDRATSSDEHRARGCAIEAGESQRQTTKIVRSHRRHDRSSPSTMMMPRSSSVRCVRWWPE